MKHSTSVIMTIEIHDQLSDHLFRVDGEEDLCLAIYRLSTGSRRRTALITEVISPTPGDREVHGNATINAQYILRAIERAQDSDGGLVLLHSHPTATGWQEMSGPDRDAESAYAYLVRETTGLPLVGMTLATGDMSWSARHWDTSSRNMVAETPCTNVRVVGPHLRISWNDRLLPPPPADDTRRRTVSCWGSTVQADLARRRILLVGAGSVGLDVFLRLVASGAQHVTLMDFDLVKLHNLDRLIGATPEDVANGRTKTFVALREARRMGPLSPNIQTTNWSICEPQGLSIALDHDLIVCCVDRPWPRAVLNGLVYTDLIPLIDGGIAIDTFDDGAMRNATWRSHVIRPGQPCLSCIRQLDMGRVALDIQGLLDDPSYIRNGQMGPKSGGQNVSALSISVAASLLAHYTSFNVAPGGFGDPGPTQFTLNTHAHPCQLLADMQTVIERRGPLAETRWAWLGDGNNVCNSLIEAAALMDFGLVVATPNRFEPDVAMCAMASTRDDIYFTEDPAEAIAGANVVVTDTWTSMGQDGEEYRNEAFAGFGVDEAMMARAAPDATFLHCLPAHRGEEVSDAVIDGPQSAVWDEAENRLHAQKALLMWVMGQL